ncbi:hypothetical protein ACISRB_27260, partial [Micromonospora aurantiaca]
MQYDEPIPPALPDAVARLGEAVRELERACKSGEDLERTRELVRQGAELAGRAWSQGVRTYGEAMISDLRTGQSELLRATGCRPEDANGTVRRAAGAGEAEARPPVRARMSRPVPRRPAGRHQPKATGRELA